MKLSIIMPLLNMEKMLERTLIDLQRQLENVNKEIEVICIDDNSTDKTLITLKKYKNKIKHFHIKNCKERFPTGTCRNQGLDIAKGEFIAFLDGDDLINIDSVLTLIEQMEKNDSDFGIGLFSKFDLKQNKTLDECLEGINIEKPYLFSLERLLYITNAACWNKIYRKSFIDQYKIRFADTVYAEDMAFVYKALILSKKIEFIELQIINYTMPRTNEFSTTKKSNIYWADLFIAFENVLEELRYHKLKMSLEEYSLIFNSLITISLEHIGYARKRITENVSFFDEKAIEWLLKVEKEYQTLIKTSA